MIQTATNLPRPALRLFAWFALLMTFAAGARAEDVPKVDVEVIGSTTATAGAPVSLRVFFKKKKDLVPYTGSVLLDATDAGSSFNGRVVEFAGESEITVTGSFFRAGKVRVGAFVVGAKEKAKVSLDIVAGPAAWLELTLPRFIMAGTSLAIGVVVQDEFHNAVTAFSATAAARASDAEALFTIAGGTGTVTLVPAVAQNVPVQVVTFTDPPLLATGQVQIVSGPPARLEVIAGDGQRSPLGRPLDSPFAVRGMDAFGNECGEYDARFRVVSGGVRLSGALAMVVTSDDRGAAEVAGDGVEVGPYEVVAEVVATPAITATITGEVARLVDRFTFADLPATIVAGTPFGGVSIHALSTDDGLVTDYAETVSIALDGASTAPNGSVAGALVFDVSFSGGVASLDGLALYRAGPAGLTFVDPLRAQARGRADVVVLPGAAVRLATGDYSGIVAARVSTALTGYVSDPYGNTVPGPARTVALAIAAAEVDLGEFYLGPSIAEARLGAVAADASDIVLLVGGRSPAGELDPVTIGFSKSQRVMRAGPPLVAGRYGHTATALAGGAVFVYGGQEPGGPIGEMFIPAAGAFVPVPTPEAYRARHQAVALVDGKVLVLGGVASPAPGAPPIATTAFFDPATGGFFPGPPLPEARANFKALTVAGKLYLVGGLGAAGPLASVLVRVPATGAFEPFATLATARAGAEVVLIGPTTLLVWGGTGADGAALATGELVSLVDGAVVPAGTLEHAYGGARLARLAEGKALLVGGTGLDGQPSRRSFLYEAATGFVPGPLAHRIRLEHVLVPLGADTGEVAVVCGTTTDAEIYRSALAVTGTFDGVSLREREVTTDTEGRFGTTWYPGVGAQTITALAAGLEATVSQFNGQRVDPRISRLTVTGVPSTLMAGSPFGFAVEALDATGARVDYAGWVVVQLPGGAPFASEMLVNMTAGLATVTGAQVGIAAPQRVSAVVFDKASMRGESDVFTVIAGPPHRLTTVSGNGQEVFLASGLTSPLVVRAADAYTNAIAGLEVSFAASAGTFTSTAGAGASTTTDLQGLAIMPAYRAPEEPGAIAIAATTPGHPVPALGLTIAVRTSVEPDQVTAVTTLVTGTAGEGPVALVFRATRDGRPIGGVDLELSVVSAKGGELTTAMVVTAADGTASALVSRTTPGRVVVEARHTVPPPVVEPQGGGPPLPPPPPEPIVLSATAEALFGAPGLATQITARAAGVAEAGSTLGIDLSLSDSAGALVGGSHLVLVTYDGVEYLVVLTEGLGHVEVDTSTAGHVEVGYEYLGEVPAEGTVTFAVSSSLASSVVGKLPSSMVFVVAGLPARIDIHAPATAVGAAGVLTGVPGALVNAPAAAGVMVEGSIRARVVDAHGNPSGPDVYGTIIEGDSTFHPLYGTNVSRAVDTGGYAWIPPIWAGQTEGRHRCRLSAQGAINWVVLDVALPSMRIDPAALHATLDGTEPPAGSGSDESEGAPDGDGTGSTEPPAPDVIVAVRTLRLPDVVPGETFQLMPALEVDTTGPVPVLVPKSGGTLPSLVARVTDATTGLPVNGVAVSYEILTAASMLSAPASALGTVDGDAIVADASLLVHRLKVVSTSPTGDGGGPMGSDSVAHGTKTDLLLEEPVTELGRRALLKTDQRGFVGQSIALAIPRNVVFKDPVPAPSPPGTPATPKLHPYVAVRVKIQRYASHASGSDMLSPEDPIAETITMIFPVRRPEIVFDDTVPETGPYATMVAGAAPHAEQRAFPRVKVTRPTPELDAAGKPLPGAATDLANQTVYFKVYDVSTKAVTDVFHQNLFELTTYSGADTNPLDRIAVVPKRHAPEALYRVVASLDPNVAMPQVEGDPTTEAPVDEPPLVPVDTKWFDIAVTTYYPNEPLINEYYTKRPFITSGLFQRENLKLDWSGAPPDTGLPSPLMADFAGLGTPEVPISLDEPTSTDGEFVYPTEEAFRLFLAQTVFKNGRFETGHGSGITRWLSGGIETFRPIDLPLPASPLTPYLKTFGKTDTVAMTRNLLTPDITQPPIGIDPVTGAALYPKVLAGWGFKITEFFDRNPPDGVGRIREEAVVALDEVRIRLVSSTSGKVITAPLIALDVMSAQDPVASEGEIATYHARVPATEFYVDVYAGDLGTHPIRLAVEGLTLLEARQDQRPLFPTIESGGVITTYHAQASEKLRSHGAAVPRRLFTPISRTPEAAAANLTGEVVYRFGPFQLTSQSLAALPSSVATALGDGGLVTNAGTEGTDGEDGVHLIQAERGVGFHVVLTGADGATPFLMRECATRYMPVHRMSLVVSSGLADIPTLGQVRPDLTLRTSGTVAAGSMIPVRLIDRAAAVLRFTKPGPTPDTTVTEPPPAPVLAIRWTQTGGTEHAGTATFTTDATHVQGDATIVVPETLDTTLSATLVLEATGALGTTSRLVAALVPFAGGWKVGVTERTPVVEPAVVVAQIDAPDGDTTLIPDVKASLVLIGGALSRELTLHRQASGRYQSDPIVIVRTDALPAALASSDLIAVGSGGGVLELSTVEMPFTAEPAPPPGEATRIVATYALRSRPRLLIESIDPDTGALAFLPTDALTPGARFKVEYTPSHRVESRESPPGSGATVQSLQIALGPMVDGIASDASGAAFEGAVVVTLVPSGAAPGTYVMVDPIAYTVGLGQDTTNVVVSDASNPISMAVTTEGDAYVVPVLQPWSRHATTSHGDGCGPYEAASGNSPQVGLGVYVHSQELVHTIDLYSLEGRGVGLELAVTYRSCVEGTTVVGRGWFLSADQRLRLVRNAAGTITGAEMYAGDGRIYSFTATGTGGFEPEPGLYVLLENVAGQYRATTVDGTEIRFTRTEYRGFNLIESETDRNANRITYHYTARGYLFEMRDPFGRELRFHYDDFGRLFEVTDFAGRTLTLLHPTEVKKPLAQLDGILLPRVTSGLASGAAERGGHAFGYDRSGRMDRTGNSTGPVFSVAYRERSGRVAWQQVGSPGRSHVVRFGPSNREVTVTRDGAETSIYRFNIDAIQEGATTSHRDTVPGIRTVPNEVELVGAGASDPSETTKFSYSLQLEIKEMVSPLGLRTETIYEGGAAILRRGNVLSIIHHGIESAETDALVSAVLGSSLGVGYGEARTAYGDALNEALEISRTYTGSRLVTTMSNYTDFGAPRSIRLPDGETTTFEFDDRGNLRFTKFHKTAAEKEIPIRESVYNDRGQLIESIDELKRRTKYRYYLPRLDPSDPEKKRFLAGGDAFRSDPIATPPAIPGGYLAEIENLATGSRVTFRRDERGNAIETVDARGVLARDTFNERDLLVEHRPGVEHVDASRFAGAIPLPSVKPVVTYTYDALGRRVRKTTSAPGADATYTEVEHDSLGRQMSTKQLLDDASNTATTEYTLDGAGRLRLAIDPEDHVTVHAYDVKGRLATATREGTAPISTPIRYRADGRPMAQWTGAKDPAGRQPELTFYDDFGRAFATLSPGAEGGTLRTSCLDARGRDRETRVYGPSSSYDATKSFAERFTVGIERLGRVARQFDELGRVKTEQVFSRPATSSSHGNDLERTTTYDLSGEVLVTSSTPTGPTIRRVYEKGRLAHLQRLLSGKVAVETSYVYDPEDRVIEQTETVYHGEGPIDPGSVGTRGAEPFTERYVFDLLGRLVTQEQFVPQSGQATPAGGAVTTIYAHDLSGNLKWIEGPSGLTENVYDLANRPTDQKVNGVRTSLTLYYKNGLVKSRTDCRGATTDYVYDRTGQLERTTYPDTTDAGARKKSVNVYEAHTGKLKSTSDRNDTVHSFTYDDAGMLVRRSAAVAATNPHHLHAVGAQMYRYDGMGRLMIAHEAAGASGAATTVYKTYDGLGRLRFEGQSLVTAEGSVMRSHARGNERFDRVVGTEYFDKGTTVSGAQAQELTTYYSTGLVTGRSKRYDGFASSWWVMAGGDDPLMSGDVEQTLDGRLVHVKHGGSLAAGGKGTASRVAAQAWLDYNERKQVRRFHAARYRAGGGSEPELSNTVGYDERTMLFKTRTNGTTLFADSASNVTTYSYNYEADTEAPGRYQPLIVSKEDTFRAGKDAGGFRQSSTSITRELSEPAVSSTARADLKAVTTAGTQRYRSPKEGKTFYEDTSALRDRHEFMDFDPLRQLTGISNHDLTTDERFADTLTYDDLGNMRTQVRTGAPVEQQQDYRLEWDAYGRLAVVVCTRTGIELGYLPRATVNGALDPKSVLWQIVKHHSEQVFAYTATNLRIAKGFETTTSSLREDDIRAYYADTVEEEKLRSLRDRKVNYTRFTTLTRRGIEVQSFSGGRVAEETVVAEVIVPGVVGAGAVNHHTSYVSQMGEHMAIIRADLSSAAEGPSLSLDPEAPTIAYVMRDDSSNPVYLVGRSGEIVLDIAVGFSGIVDYETEDGDPRWDPWALQYGHGAGGTRSDADTTFQLMDDRVYWPWLQRYVAPEPGGVVWSTPDSDGDPYASFGGFETSYGTWHASKTPEASLLDNLGKVVYGVDPISGRSVSTLDQAGIMAGWALTLSSFTNPWSAALYLGFEALGYANDEYDVTGRAQVFLETHYYRHDGPAVVAKARQQTMALLGLDSPLADVKSHTLQAAEPTLARNEDRNSAGGPSGDMGNCFVAGTLVRTKEGVKRIEEIAKGDLVLSRNEKTGEQGWKPVLQTFVSHPDALVALSVRAVLPANRSRERRAGGGDAGGGEDGDGEPPLAGGAEGASATKGGAAAGDAAVSRIVGTEGHPIWSVWRNGWVLLGNLRVGERLLREDGSQAEVVAAARTAAREGHAFTTYNFEVADWHTYFVAADVDDTAILVHNFSYAAITALSRALIKKAGVSSARTFANYRSFRAALGKAGRLRQWHHIVEQYQVGIGRFTAAAIQNTNNIIALPRSVHRRVSGLYSSIRENITGSRTLTIRKWLSGQSFADQHAFGLRAIREVVAGRW